MTPGMDHTTQYDVIVIGSGAGGGTLLHDLAPTGKRILVLERGGYLPREADNWSSRRVFVDNHYKAKEIWTDRHGQPFHPEIHYYVGGNSKLYGAALPRFRAEDFGELRLVDGLSPAWPVGYDEFEPFYTAAERLYQVRGQAGADPTEPPRSAPYAHGPLRHEPYVAKIHDAFAAEGLHPYPLPMAVMRNEDDPRAAPCIKCATCDGYPCKLHAKADAETVCVAPALAHPNVELWTEAFVERLETGADPHRVDGVVVTRNGETLTVRGDVVVVSAGAINSAALLLRSRSPAWPNGLANATDNVGRYYMCHNNSAFVAISPEVNETVFQKTLGMNDWYFGDDEVDHPLGHVQTMGKADAEKFEAASPVPLPQFVYRQMGRHSVDFWLTSEDMPVRDNRVVVDADGRIGLHYVENNLAAHDRLNRNLTRLLQKVGKRLGPLPLTKCMRKKVPIHGTTHQCGTLRFGDDPATSVLDRDCKAHDVDNLYVVDASFMPSSAALNPALTIFANALRVGAHLRARLG